MKIKDKIFIFAPKQMLLGILVCLALYPTIPAQTLETVPSRVLVDESATIRARGLQPNEQVRVEWDQVPAGTNESSPAWSGSGMPGKEER